MHLETRIVSRKTPRDGKLEISADSASRLGKLGDLTVVGPRGAARAVLSTMECTCAKGEGAFHVHHFLESPVLATLAPETHVRILLDEPRATVLVQAT